MLHQQCPSIWVSIRIELDSGRISRLLCWMKREIAKRRRFNLRTSSSPFLLYVLLIVLNNILPSFVGWLCVISSHPRGNVIPHNSSQYPCDLSLLLLFLFFLLLPIINDYTLSSMGSGWASIDRWFSTKYLHRKMINQQETVKTVDPYRSIHPSPV